MSRPVRSPHALVVLAAAPLAAAGCRWDWERFEPRGGGTDVARPGERVVPLGGAGAWEPTFQEECDGAAIDPRRWNTRFFRENLQPFRYFSWSQSFADDRNVTMADGRCRFTVEPRGGGPRPFATGALDSGAGKFEQRGGFFEVRLRAPRGAGLRTVALLTSSLEWPPQIDLASIPGNDTTRPKQALTYRDKTLPADKEVQRVEARVAPGPDYADDFHAFGVDWDWEAGTITYFVDGVKSWQAPAAAVPWVNTRVLKFEITVHVAPDGAESPDASTVFPAHLEIDWIRAWRRVGP